MWFGCVKFELSPTRGFNSHVISHIPISTSKSTASLQLHQSWMLALHNPLNKPIKDLYRYIEVISENGCESERTSNRWFCVRGRRLHHSVPPGHRIALEKCPPPRMSASFGSMASFAALAIPWRCNGFPCMTVSSDAFIYKNESQVVGQLLKGPYCFEYPQNIRIIHSTWCTPT